MRIRGTHHLAVRSPDLVTSERFYVDVLGLEVIDRFFFEDGAPRSIWVALGADAFLALEVGPTGPQPVDDDPGWHCDSGWHCFALRIDARDRARWRERLTRAGYPIERESAYTLYVRDPSGALLGLSHHPVPEE